MLLPLAYSAAPPKPPTAPAPFVKPQPSPYDPPADLTPGPVNRRTHPVLVDGDIKISRLIDWDTSDPKNPQIVQNWLLVETGDHSDHIHVRSWPGNRLKILINGTSHLLDINEKPDLEQSLWIKAKGGDDTVIIDADVTLRVDIEGGDGADYLQAGGGRSRLFGGRGSDFLRLGSGLGYAEGNEDDDAIIGGTGSVVMYGNQGDDRLYAGSGPATKQSYLDGGDGRDFLHAGSGHSVLHGGNDDDRLAGYDRTTFYTGKGRDQIWNNQREDRIYADANDRYDKTQGSAFTEVKPSNVGEQGFTVQGDARFQQRVTDDFEFLRSSPLGQLALAKMDELAGVNGGKVTITPAPPGVNAYEFVSTALDTMTPEAKNKATATDYGTITDGAPGARADRGSIFYDAQSILESADQTNTTVPVTALFHEIAHAYNGATGTFLAGQSSEQLESGESEPVNNDELQAVGLPNSAKPFDLDLDPLTPPGTFNPKQFTENALNAEMDKPLRKLYAFETSDQGNGT